MLTNREMQIVELLRNEPRLNNKEIGKRLGGIAEQTVKNHTLSAFRKLGIFKRRELSDRQLRLFPLIRIEDTLTRRQVEILQRLVIEGSVKRVANSLGLSIKTVESHKNSLMVRLDLHSQTELAVYTIRAGLVKI